MRFVRVMKKELLEGKKNLFIYSITIVMVMFIQEFVGAFIIKMTGGTQPFESSYLGNFTGFLFLGGFIVTSMMFSQDMFNRTGQHNWLMLPASRLEKFGAKAVLSAFAYPIVLTLLVTVASIVVEALTLLFFGNPFSPFIPWTANVGKMVLHYVATQSVFLLGATYFRKTHFVKTVLTIGIIGILMGLLATLFVRIAFAPYFTGPFDLRIDLSVIDNHHTIVTLGRWIGNIFYWLVLPVFCWFTAYLRVKEVQSTDAIQ